MGVAEKYNSGNVWFNDLDTSKFDYKSLKDIFETVGDQQEIMLRGVFINKKSKYGDAPVAITNTCYVNLPQHLLQTVKDMLSDSEFIDAVNAEKVAFRVYVYESKHRQEPCYSVRFIDL